MTSAKINETMRVISDRPNCVSITVAAALTHVNDYCPDDYYRERLLAHLPRIIIGTRGTVEHEVTRAQLFATYANAAADAVADAGVVSDVIAAINADHAARAAAEARSSKCMAVAAALTKIAAAYAADAVADAARCDGGWESKMQNFIDFIVEQIIPVYTTRGIACGDHNGHTVDNRINE